MGDHHVGRQARLMSQALRKLTAIIARSNVVVIFINQIRMKIGVMFGNPETTTGGNALKFYSSVRIEIRRAAQIKKNEEVVGNRINVKVVKNKVAPPFRHTEFDIMYNQGISFEGDLIDTGIKFEVLKKSGNSIHYGDMKLGAGFTEFIPVVGPLFAAIPAVLIGTTQNGFFWGIVVAAVYYVIQWCENNLIVPLIMKRAVGLSPTATMMAMMVGVSFPTIVHPILGVILSIPSATVIALFLEDLRERRRRKMGVV
jgi:hypothetical protein